MIQRDLLLLDNEEYAAAAAAAAYAMDVFEQNKSTIVIVFGAANTRCEDEHEAARAHSAAR